MPPPNPLRGSRVAGAVAAVRPDAVAVVTGFVYPRPRSSLSAATSEPSACGPNLRSGHEKTRSKCGSSTPRRADDRR
jgi:hypothetical protein